MFALRNRYRPDEALANKPLQTDERRAPVPAYSEVTLAPLAAERQTVMLTANGLFNVSDQRRLV